MGLNQSKLKSALIRTEWSIFLAFSRSYLVRLGDLSFETFLPIFIWLNCLLKILLSILWMNLELGPKSSSLSASNLYVLTILRFSKETELGASYIGLGGLGSYNKVVSYANLSTGDFDGLIGCGPSNSLFFLFYSALASCYLFKNYLMEFSWCKVG